MLWLLPKQKLNLKDFPAGLQPLIVVSSWMNTGWTGWRIFRNNNVAKLSDGKTRKKNMFPHCFFKKEEKKCKKKNTHMPLYYVCEHFYRNTTRPVLTLTLTKSEPSKRPLKLWGPDETSLLLKHLSKIHIPRQPHNTPHLTSYHKEHKSWLLLGLNAGNLLQSANI